MKVNKRLKAAILEVADNQLTSNDPPEANQTLQRLMKEGISREDAKIYIAQAVTVEIYEIMANGKQFDLDRYRANLARLPEPPYE